MICSCVAECSCLKEQLTQSNLDHDLQVSKLQTHMDKIDSERTELKLQVVELHLETSELEKQLEEGEKEWTGRVREMEADKERKKKEFEERLASLEEQNKEVRPLMLVFCCEREYCPSRTIFLRFCMNFLTSLCMLNQFVVK